MEIGVDSLEGPLETLSPPSFNTKQQLSIQAIRNQSLYQQSRFWHLTTGWPGSFPRGGYFAVSKSQGATSSAFPPQRKQNRQAKSQHLGKAAVSKGDHGFPELPWKATGVYKLFLLFTQNVLDAF